ncbi:carboxylesterase/lipase family protein [Pseudonocardia sp. GCM10023141]|uniref:carboxylesterase/lipase family protein n=1 Tax=Pseudonocardia sp. GCM10023141 TaxID=3252653 RepID=UPI0036233ABA
MTRPRGAAVLALAGAAALLVSCSGPTAAAGPPLGQRVHVEQGDVVGLDDAGTLRFQGIPYAAPPVGALRWVAPQPPATWAQPLEATAPGARCAQLAAPAGVAHATAASNAEDCLTLNVTTPATTTANSKLPVLVWLHGGGFNAGAGSDTDPRRLAAAGPLVVVTVNYRLGIFGFLGLPGLADSGSFGLLDQQAALRWVQRNIASFGGDPRAVTLAGESAGADSVCAQLASPGAAGLVSRAVLQSGGCSGGNLVDVIRPGTGPLGDTWKPLPLVESAGSTAAGALGCPDPATALSCLRALPPDRIVGGAGVYWSPATGTATLPRRPSDVVADGGMPPIPVLAGTNRDEGTLFTSAFFVQPGTPLTDNGFRTLLAAAAGSRSGAAGRAYPVLDRSPDRAWSDVITDRAYACSGLVTYQRLAGTAPVYAYEFADPTAPPTFVAPPPDLAGTVTHAAELAYLFDLVPGQPSLTPAQLATAAQLVGAWARFASTGDPSGDGTMWPRWSGGGAVWTVTDRGATVVAAGDFAAMHHCEIWGS